VTTKILYEPRPDRVRATHVESFRRRFAERLGRAIDDTRELHAASVEHIPEFWDAVWDECGVVGERGARVLAAPREMPGARFFPDARLNFAENLLRRSDDAIALVFATEEGTRRTLTFAQLTHEVRRLRAAMRARGVVAGDRVAAYLPNMPETIAVMLAAASLGATFSSCSPDFGVAGVLDRFGQIEPKLLFATDGYLYGGKRFGTLEKTREIAAQLPSLVAVVVVPNLEERPAIEGIVHAVRYEELVASAPDEPLAFERLPFSHPLYVLYSSGTTGKPKCIVHGAGGTLLQHLKEHRLHTDVHEGERLFYFTTCGWMMWNWLVSGLASGATLVLFDGNPFAGDGHVLFDLADRERIDVFGTSAKFIDAVHKSGLEPMRTHSLESVRAILSTGSPLSPESFDFVYESIKRDVLLASISGGTDIVSCFVLGDPTRPVRRGEIQGPGLGMDVQIWNDEGERVVGEQGELVCASPFPSMPVGFWNDDDGSRYHAAYFERFPGVWCHGDFTMETPEGGYVITGRSDAVLNPGGVRIGTAEIYRQVERLPEILESVVIGQPWDGDVRVVLFVVLAEGVALDDELVARIKTEIRTHTSPRHVPAKVLAVPEIPRTRSGKISELTVRRVVMGEEPRNVEALANPESLAHFRGRVELST
jgi:acetoacetyl-CoA synthetase